MEIKNTNTSLELKPPFKVHISNNKALLWNIEEIRFLRENYRIVGSFIGCLPRYPLQNQLFGLPMTLLNEEVTLLLSKGLIILVDDKKSHQSPTNAQIKEFEQKSFQEENKQLQEYINFIEEKKLKIKNLKKNNTLNHDIKEKINKAKKTNLNDLKEENTLLQQKKESRNLESTPNSENKTSKVNGFAPIINIKTSSTSFTWYNNNENWFDSINTAKQNNLWIWPSTLKDIQKYKIYSDLWNKGYYITSGIKFGGDYLLYPGDPLKYHSHFIATVFDINKIISPMDIITFGRLGTTVKKSYMLCSWNQQEDKAIYFCLEWSGYG
ncbi:uncharacterized protein OCT59_001910 [Rhizophagus irregularis]|uniref:tRNA-splicing endonuclease subunit Sen34 n=3 Tax=Rhizophagus irregularis TaxID=588596 RepID=A0A2I1EAR7_9GLOM|nr:hypothetical protein GLOIN_2v1727928 [Rhizophagus irregularis DAOM 181602=DAOM 197198]PKY19194.1 hypothetical protein RhiirB3_469029 [Rhizophagus irregularis]POG58740.1 hypothetical protein GLOIN_2v1727928 [Rhizophagus irregularis DAOM 181602=DAOM 197198]UZO10319.1 hypothetical protein OCT59_001910 [Rhizophagus irregularis]CAB4481704.1 unnamed protein product [Rhizophagus irregularis]CAB5169454.1 unnamed protein product [Rhizophagus irregularis]|eukprot:XP_025165606.1 hypothetical protein GLOIN_2v1727928 [Rhizophagus irregularis DAOM 181602=DAOM 197198]